MDLSFLPAVNATLNSIAAVLLVVAVVAIRRKQVKLHRNLMIAAFTVSALFLITYVTHYVWRAQVQGGVHTKYHGQGVIRTFYYAMLISHILLAMIVPVAAIWQMRLGFKLKLAAHRKLGRWTVPVWLYVSVTGVLIYLMLYVWNPQV